MCWRWARRAVELDDELSLGHRSLAWILMQKDRDFDEKGLALSPDGKWIAYESTETGRDEVYVRPFPNSQDGKWQVSTLGGFNPKWSHSGEELFYVSADEMTAARVSTEGRRYPSDPGPPPALQRCGARPRRRYTELRELGRRRGRPGLPHDPVRGRHRRCRRQRVHTRSELDRGVAGTAWKILKHGH